MLDLSGEPAHGVAGDLELLDPRAVELLLGAVSQTRGGDGDLVAAADQLA